MSNYTHLIISGGALYGVCVLGIFRYMYIENLSKNIKNIAGNSMGAWFALAFSLNIPLDVLENIIKEIAKENNILFTKNNFNKLFKNNGIMDFRCFTNPVKKYIKDKYDLDDITFLELSKKFGINLHISATNITYGKNKIFCLDDTPNVSIFDATRASMTLPFIGIPVLIKDEQYADGILTNNFPISIFSNVLKDNILGIAIKISYNFCLEKLDNKSKLIDYSKRILEIIINEHSKQTYINYINNDQGHILVIEDSPINSYIPFNVKNNKVHCKFVDKDVDNLILDGFIKISKFIKHIKKEQNINYNDRTIN